MLANAYDAGLDGVPLRRPWTQEGKVLEAVGLSSREIIVYQALMTRPGADAAQLAEDCALAESEVGATLLRLVKDGLAVQSGRPARYEAAAPDIALAELIRRQEQLLNSARTEMHRLTQLFRDAGAAGDAGSVEVISGSAAIAMRVSRLYEAARTQVRTLDRPPYVQRPGDDFGRLLRRQREGIVYRTIYSREALAWPGRFQEDILAGSSTEQARVRVDLPTKLILSDDTMALMPMSADDRTGETAFVIRSSALLSALGALFEHEWSRAVPLVAPPRQAPEDADRPDERTRALLSLLAGGLTDEAISRALGWSARTTQRRIAALLKELGVSTRFQAGAAARDRGWL